MGKLNSKMAGVLLLMAMAVVSAMGQDGMIMPGMAARPSGCHHHGPSTPAPVPVSYRCCQSGHDSAILQTSFTVSLSSARLVSGHDSIPARLAHATQSCLRGFTISSPDPPAMMPLRV